MLINDTKRVFVDSFFEKVGEPLPDATDSWKRAFIRAMNDDIRFEILKSSVHRSVSFAKNIEKLVLQERLPKSPCNLLKYWYNKKLSRKNS